MAAHFLKIYPEYLNQIIEGKKTFEFRKNDRNYCVGDVLFLKEWLQDKKVYTGRSIQVKIKNLMPIAPLIDIKTNWVCMSIVQF